MLQGGTPVLRNVRQNDRSLNRKKKPPTAFCAARGAAHRSIRKLVVVAIVALIAIRNGVVDQSWYVMNDLDTVNRRDTGMNLDAPKTDENQHQAAASKRSSLGIALRSHDESHNETKHPKTSKHDNDVRNDIDSRSASSPRILPFQRFSEYAPTCRRISADEVTFTLVTQTSDNRLWLVRHHCLLWKGPISVAILTNQSKDEISRRLHKRGKYGCSANQVSVATLAVDSINSEDDYPVNVLRNLAFRNVRTTHVMYTDVDFWVSRNLYPVLTSQTLRDAFASDRKLAVVVPAFQMDASPCKKSSKACHEDNIRDMPRKMAELLPQLTEQIILKEIKIKARKGRRKKKVTTKPVLFGMRATPFQERAFPQAHNDTNYKVWYRQETGTLVQIPCVQTGVYEPYLATRYCRDMPPFQEVFSGYGQNKATWMLQLRRSGYVFKQVGGSFVVHFPHGNSKAKEVWMQHPKSLDHYWMNPIERNVTDNLQDFKRGRMDQALLDFRRWMGATLPDKERTRRCENWIDLDWRLWVKSDEEKVRLPDFPTTDTQLPALEAMEESTDDG